MGVGNAGAVVVVVILRLGARKELPVVLSEKLWKRDRICL
jgi:hypothetical protein